MLGAQPREPRQQEGSKCPERQAGGSDSNRPDVVELDDCGRVVGKVIAPIGDVVFGHGCGSVYLKRN